MAAGGRHLKRLLGFGLADDFGHVSGVGRVEHRLPGLLADGQVVRHLIAGVAAHHLDEFADVPDPDDLRSLHQRGLVKVGIRHHHAVQPAFPGVQHDGQQPVDGQDRAVQIDLADHHDLVQAVRRNRPGGAQHAGRDRQVMRGTAFGHGGGGEVHGDPRLWPTQAAGMAGRFDAFAGLGQRGVGQADDAEVRQAGEMKACTWMMKALMPINPMDNAPPMAIRTPPVCGAAAVVRRAR